MNQAPAFVLDSPPLTAVAGQPYDYTFEASGTPAPTYALASGAPSWLSVNASTGEVTGTPPAGTTTFSYTVTADQHGRHGHRRAVHGHRHQGLTQRRHLRRVVLPGRHHRGRHRHLHPDRGQRRTRHRQQSRRPRILLPAALSEISCTSGCARHANAFTWTLASLASGASAKFAITVKASATGNVLVLAAAASQNPDPHPLNNISIRPITITR